MAEDYKIQLSTKVNGNLLNLRAQSAEELKDLIQGLAKNVDDTFQAFGEFKDAVILKDVFTGDAAKDLPNDNKSSANRNASSDGTPSCKHGPMKDLRHKGYKSDFYCSESDRDKQCKPVKL